MTAQMQETLNKIFENVGNEQLSPSQVFNNVYDAMSENAQVSGGIYKYFFPETKGIKDKDARAAALAAKKAVKADLFNRFRFAMPHIMEAGTDKVTICDFVEADPTKEYAIAFTQCRTSVDDEVHTYSTAVNMAQAEREVAVKETITYASGFEKEVPSVDAEGKVIKENRVVNVVPREKTQWGYTNTVKQALLNAFIAWEIENGLA